MRKLCFILFLTLIIASAICGCGRKTDSSEDVDITSASVETVVTDVQTTVDVTVTCEPQTTVAVPDVTDEPSAEISSVSEVQAEETLPPETTAVTMTGTADNTEVNSVFSGNNEQTATSVELTVELPEANGEMCVDCSSENEFIMAVARERGIDCSLLAAVYTVPANNQNYVLEFYSAGKQTKDNLRRVYLLDDKCRIDSVAAGKSEEKENISATENWFCFNVLIKGVIFDAIKDELTQK